MNNGESPFRRLPPVHELLRHSRAAVLESAYGRLSLLAALRSALERERDRIARGDSNRADPDHLLASAADLLAEARLPGLRRVINATGIVVHTNLGRAPIAEEAIEAIAMVAEGYCNLEFDLTEGTRGSRTQAIEPLVRELTGAEAALVVNNGAAAVLLALSALAGGGEVIVSRGELVEIGGGFRIPDVISQGGARLVEVGATNKTRLADYRAAIGPDTRVLLKVHQSNFRMTGFTAEAKIAELSGLAREHNLLVVADLGSGLLEPMPGALEPTLREALAAGADLITCSGDKLLGGPQAGLIVGAAEALEPLRRHPLLRAVRLDKLALAVLETTLMLHRDAPRRVPVRRMLSQTETELLARAERLRDMLGSGIVERSDAFAGGGSLPEQRIASHALVLELSIDAHVAAARLRAARPAVVGRIVRDRIVLDMLTVSDDELADLAAAIKVLLA